LDKALFFLKACPRPKITATNFSEQPFMQLVKKGNLLLGISPDFPGYPLNETIDGLKRVN
jgi:hypothetical protein